MNIQYDAVWIGDDDSPVVATSLNGRQIVQEADFMRAASAMFFARHNRSINLAVTVTRKFDTVAECELFKLGHYDQLVDGPALLTCRCGAFGETTTDVLIAGTVLESVAFGPHRGTGLEVTYNFRCPRITAILPPEDDDMRSATVSIPPGVDTYEFTGLAFPSVPTRILPHVSIPEDGDLIHASVVIGSVSTDGFKVNFSSVVPTADYLLDFSYAL